MVMKTVQDMPLKREPNMSHQTELLHSELQMSSHPCSVACSIK